MTSNENLHKIDPTSSKAEDVKLIFIEEKRFPEFSFEKNSDFALKDFQMFQIKSFSPRCEKDLEDAMDIMGTIVKLYQICFPLFLEYLRSISTPQVLYFMDKIDISSIGSYEAFIDELAKAMFPNLDYTEEVTKSLWLTPETKCVEEAEALWRRTITRLERLLRRRNLGKRLADSLLLRSAVRYVSPELRDGSWVMTVCSVDDLFEKAKIREAQLRKVQGQEFQ